MSALVSYEAFGDECAAIFFRRLSELASADQVIDMRHWFQCYAFDVIGMITYVKRFGFLDQGEDIGNIMSALDDHIGYMTHVGIFPGLHQYLFPLMKYMAGKKGAGREYILNFTTDRIRDAKSKPKAVWDDLEAVIAEDFLTKFLAKETVDWDVFTSFHVLSGLSATLYYLLKHPSCLQKLKKEIADLSAKGELSQFPTFKESQQIPYLQAVFKETLRLHPATGLPLERVVPKGGATIAERLFPEGTIVGINPWVAHGGEEVFGPNANDFSPERWLDSTPEQLAAMNKSWMPFGLGSRTCIGRHISMLEMCKLIPLIIRDFEFTLNESLSNQDWKTSNCWFVKLVDFKVRVKRVVPV